jgi:phosphohistidine phosphatase SixA
LTTLKCKRAGAFALAIAVAAGASSAAPPADAWRALEQPGAIVLFRHATAPGVGDPAEFKLSDCATQRNLTEAGRDEARRLGQEFRMRRITVGAVLTSQWCRARDTAKLAFGDDHQLREEPAFNSFFSGSTAQRDAQTQKARELLMRWSGPGVLVVVTHQVNIGALAGDSVASGHGVVMRKEDGALKVVGRIAP